MNLCSWQTVWDFDAPGIDRQLQLERLHYAITRAPRQCAKRECGAELEFAMRDCKALLALRDLDGVSAEGACVPQRIARIKRVVTYHEGHLARWNRRFWWVPFSMLLFFVVVSGLPDFIALLERL